MKDLYSDNLNIWKKETQKLLDNGKYSMFLDN